MVFCRLYVIGKAELSPHCQLLLTNLFMALTKEGSQENEYVMKGNFEINLSILRGCIIQLAMS